MLADAPDARQGQSHCGGGGGGGGDRREAWLDGSLCVARYSRGSLKVKQRAGERISMGSFMAPLRHQRAF